MRIVFGNITFNHFTEDELKLFKTDSEYKALVHSIDKISLYKDREELLKLIDEFENQYPSWVVPSVFEGEIVYDC